MVAQFIILSATHMLQELGLPTRFTTVEGTQGEQTGTDCTSSDNTGPGRATGEPQFAESVITKNPDGGAI